MGCREPKVHIREMVLTHRGLPLDPLHRLDVLYLVHQQAAGELLVADSRTLAPLPFGFQGSQDADHLSRVHVHRRPVLLGEVGVDSFHNNASFLRRDAALRLVFDVRRIAGVWYRTGH